ncbi:preprotein translocase subunit SecE [Paradesertivirga mongoliensis]|uniref:Protein translocase subunit SecE n=1 Tax=Paradesertivirga mongoliensis TaxID=2100740 RepID=A0ABW4ZKE2_9SPHI|nr:preprotein translocase subunit SecE [Pedobacter mongoliensis]
MAKVVEFLKESYDEMTTKVSWPTWSELQNSAVIVLVASLIIAVMIFAMDNGIRTIIESYYHSVTNA